MLAIRLIACLNFLYEYFDSLLLIVNDVFESFGYFFSF